MDVQLVAFGQPEQIEKHLTNAIYSSNNGMYAISASYHDYTEIVENIRKDGATAYTKAQADKMVTGSQNFVPLEGCDVSTAFDWLSEGNEHFAVQYERTFEINSIERKNVANYLKAEPIVEYCMGNTGALIAFRRNIILSIHINQSLDKIFELKFLSPILNAEFNSNDTLIAIETADELCIADVKRNKEVLRTSAQKYSLLEKSLYLLDEKTSYKIADGIATKNEELQTISEVAVDGKKVAQFIDGKIQKIIFLNNEIETSKNHINVSSVKFYFSANKLYALITKKINNEEQYIIECYYNKDIYMVKLAHKPVEISVADNSFVVFDSRRQLIFYQKDRYSFSEAKTIAKDGPAKLALQNDILCVYDSVNENVEFYDKMRLRAVYSQKDCSEIVWSESGLYVAVVSYSSEINGLLQIFSCDGVLLHKKMYNLLKKFSWRKYLKMSAEKKRDVYQMELEESQEDENDVEDVEILLSSWKGYLISKLQVLKG
ncbi:hypothetical protein ENBRE01_1076 [Enteropsectra breve]|nr:hypothetical protein ENBRE01_1076 [Enteropsectra breve]